MNEYYTTSTFNYSSKILSLNLIYDRTYNSILYNMGYGTNDYTLIHVDEPNVIGINERMVND